MTSRTLSLAVLCLTAVLAPARPATACSCDAPSVCSAFWNADRVFTGAAEVIASVRGGAQLTRFRVERSFRGSAETIQIDSRGIGGSCDYEFVNGVRYLVFARKLEGIWKASICSRTGPLDQARDDLAFAQSVAQDPQRGGTVSSHVGIGERTRDGKILGISSLAGATVTLRSDAHVWTGESDARGRYEFKSVPPGRYLLGARFTPQFEPVGPVAVTVRGPGDCVAYGFTAIRKAAGRQ